MLLGLVAILPAFAVKPFTVIADGLAFPRGLTFGPGRVLYVAQAGAGGGTTTSKITGIRNPAQADQSIADVVIGLISVTTPQGDAIGVAGLSAIGNGTIYAATEASISKSGFGHLIKASHGGEVRDVAAVGDFDWAWTIDPDRPDGVVAIFAESVCSQQLTFRVRGNRRVLSQAREWSSTSKAMIIVSLSPSTITTRFC